MSLQITSGNAYDTGFTADNEMGDFNCKQQYIVNEKYLIL